VAILPLSLLGAHHILHVSRINVKAFVMIALILLHGYGADIAPSP